MSRLKERKGGGGGRIPGFLSASSYLRLGGSWERIL